ncbi:hypothetical protein SO694_00001375 [Aureococcus anophagefferens]|uniref:Protein ENHANCED DISEASE RESISTANCE 2 C-terminal domain-containing protein n=1 Tax=Aureococcus anophagefferens TaxID=44056 RepID=A0ABR1GBG6_AURAN
MIRLDAAALDGAISIASTQQGQCATAVLVSKRLLLRDGAYWSEPDPYGFKVRGPSYLMDKVKVPCGPALFHLLDCDLFDIDEPQPHMARHLKDRMAALWAESGLLVEGKRPYTMIVQLQVRPTPPFVVERAVGEVPTLLGNKIQQFYFAPPDGDYFEVDCNIASSRIAQYTIGLAIDPRGGAPAELPGALIGAVRIEHIVMRDATKLDLSKSTSPP